MDRHTSLLEQMALADFIEAGLLERHVRRMRRLYQQRRMALVSALDHHFGEAAEILGGQAGMQRAWSPGAKAATRGDRR